MRPRALLIVPDKFKGTLTARQAAEAIARGWSAAHPDDTCTLLPMSDGGDGFGEIVSQLLKAKLQTTKALDAAHRTCEASWWWQASEKTAIIESARVVGLAQLPAGKYHPFELDTEGLGLLLQAAREKKAKRCLVGIGGSATNDGGFGMARALGWRFFNARDEKIVRWTELHNLAQVRPPEKIRLFAELIVAVDVQNPLLGPNGCTRIYGPQKRLRPRDFAFAEKCLRRMSDILAKQLHLNYADEPGAGAAGGLGFGLRCFAAAQLRPGFDIFSRYAQLPKKVKAADLVITGEGSIDNSTLMGKGVGQVAQMSRNGGVPCLGLAGVSSREGNGSEPFTRVFAIVPKLTTSEQAVAEPAVWLERLARHVAETWGEQ